MTPDEYAVHDATALQELIARGEVSASEVLTAALSAADRLNPRLNAIINRFDDRARMALRAQEPHPAKPFAGVPFLIKDITEFAGVRSSYGANLTKGVIATETHPLLERMLDTGVVPFGQTNTSELGLVPTTEPIAFGPTRNPWNLGYSSGGSSGGAAAAVAAGMVPMAHGSDGGGSIRIPAAACGVFGLKPSRGRNPFVWQDDPDGFVATHVLTRSVRDSARMLDATAGGRLGDRFYLPRPEVPYAEWCARDPERLRVAFCTRDFSGRPADEAGRAAVSTLVETLAVAGHDVVEAAPAIDADAFAEAFGIVWASGPGVYLDEVQKLLLGPVKLGPLRRLLAHRPWFDGMFRLVNALSPTPLLEPMTLRLARADAQRRPSDMWQSWKVLNRSSATMTSFFDSFDVWVTPVLGEPTWRIGQFVPRGTDRQVSEVLFRYSGYTPIANAAGLPAMSVPGHLSRDGLPVGVQCVAAMGREDLLFSLAGFLERAGRLVVRRPPHHVASKDANEASLSAPSTAGAAPLRRA